MAGCEHRAADWRWLWRDEADWSPCAGDSVHLWRASLDRDGASVQQWLSLLSQEERDRASQYRFDLDRNRFIVRRGILREILARYLGAKPEAVRFRMGEFGKLQLSDSFRPSLEFSVTHSRGKALVALARGHCVGVDLEHVLPLSDLDLMINECLSHSERCTMQALSPPCRLECFYWYWTSKEACLKASGVGLNRRIDSVRISLPGAGSACKAELEDGGEESRGLSVWSFVPFSGCVAATATTPACTQHELFAI